MKISNKKSYVLTVSTTFPAYHPRRGEWTEFTKSILAKTKIHTIRANYELWRKRFEKIDKGEAVLSLRYWSGQPYRSKQSEFKRLQSTDGIGLQKLSRPDTYDCAPIDGRGIEWDIVAANDGLSFDDFKQWFRNPGQDPMAVIHFTNFRY